MTVHTVRLLGGAATMLLAAWLTWYLTTRPAKPVARDGSPLPPVEPLRTAAEVAEVADKTAWIGGVRELEMARNRSLEENTVALDRAALVELFRRQDREVGEEYVRGLEARLAAGFGLIELEGAAR